MLDVDVRAVVKAFLFLLLLNFFRLLLHSICRGRDLLYLLVLFEEEVAIGLRLPTLGKRCLTERSTWWGWGALHARRRGGRGDFCALAL